MKGKLQSKKNRKAVKFRYNNKKKYSLYEIKQVWKFIIFPLFIILISAILVIPTLIVIPYGSSEQKNLPANNLTKELDHTDELNSQVSVTVMRSTSETVEDLPLETYIIGVVASEMNAEFELEALKAQAVAARTFTVNHLLQQDSSEDFDITDTVNHQVYQNEKELREQWGSDFDENMKKLKEAVETTEGEILTYNDSPIFAAFFSTSNGYTENSEDYWTSELPYLRSVESPWDKDSPKFLHQETLPIAKVAAALGIELSDNKHLSIDETRTESGRVKELEIEGNTFSGRDVRDTLRLRSSDFTIEQNNGHLIITTKGFGHGVGMSQYGANFMAKTGKTYKDILTYYYQGVEISTISDTALKLVSK